MSSSPQLTRAVPFLPPKTKHDSMSLAVWARGTTPESLKCYHSIITMELLRWNSNRWGFFTAHPWFSGLAQHRCHAHRKKFIFNSVFLIAKNSWLSESRLRDSVPLSFSNHLAPAEGIPAGRFPCCHSHHFTAAPCWNQMVAQRALLIIHPPAVFLPLPPSLFCSSNKTFHLEKFRGKKKVLNPPVPATSTPQVKAHFNS